MKNITIFLMTKKGYSVLKAIEPSFRNLISVVVIGRDAALDDDFSSRIVDLCIDLRLEYVFRESFIAVKTEFALAVSWRWLIKHPVNKLVVFHDSILPSYRGFAPLVNSLINGESSIGVTALLGALEYDRGDVICQSRIDVQYPMKIGDAIDLIVPCYIECVNYILRFLDLGEQLVATPQSDEEATYSLWRDELDYRIDWSCSAIEISRFVDAVGSPYKGASSLVGEKVVRITSVQVVRDVKIINRPVGKVIFVQDGFPVVVCGVGLLKVLECCCEASKESILPLSMFRVRFS